ncbi:MAG TPA: alpha/beta hydrolase [Candidatus Limnocylindrales bacterium]|jgi:pimeloyl-ACP methyl ester carboxylesterase
MRARYPDESGFVDAQGARLFYEVYGAGDPTIVLLPSLPIIHSRQWKAQIPFLSRHYRVIAFDGRGNGRSDRPSDPALYADSVIVDDIEAVMDATDTDRAVLVGLCYDGVWRAVLLATTKPDRVLGIASFAAGVPKITPPLPHRLDYSFDDVLDTTDGWAKVNRHYWQRDYPGFAQFFFEQVTSEAHSTKQIEDAVEWAVEGSVDAMLADAAVDNGIDKEQVEEICRRVPCPMLLVHGDEDSCQPISRSRRLSELTGAPLVEITGADHMIPGRHPVKANLLIREFVRGLQGSRS